MSSWGQQKCQKEYWLQLLPEISEGLVCFGQTLYKNEITSGRKLPKCFFLYNSDLCEVSPKENSNMRHPATADKATQSFVLEPDCKCTCLRCSAAALGRADPCPVPRFAETAEQSPTYGREEFCFLLVICEGHFVCVCVCEREQIIVGKIVIGMDLLYDVETLLMAFVLQKS